MENDNNLDSFFSTYIFQSARATTGGLLNCSLSKQVEVLEDEDEDENENENAADIRGPILVLLALNFTPHHKNHTLSSL